MFADDTKLKADNGDLKKYETLQGALDALAVWQDRWMMRFNQSTCSVSSLRRGSGRLRWNCRLAGESLEDSYYENYLGILIQKTLSFDRNFGESIRAVHALLINKRIAPWFTNGNMFTEILYSVC